MQVLVVGGGGRNTAHYDILCAVVTISLEVKWTMLSAH